MKVYVVIYAESYEPAIILGVFDSYEKALKCNTDPEKSDYIWIEDYEVE